MNSSENNTPEPLRHDQRTEYALRHIGEIKGIFSKVFQEIDRRIDDSLAHLDEEYIEELINECVLNPAPCNKKQNGEKDKFVFPEPDVPNANDWLDERYKSSVLFNLNKGSRFVESGYFTLFNGKKIPITEHKNMMILNNFRVRHSWLHKDLALVFTPSVPIGDYGVRLSMKLVLTCKSILDTITDPKFKHFTQVIVCDFEDIMRNTARGEDSSQFSIFATLMEGMTALIRVIAISTGSHINGYENDDALVKEILLGKGGVINKAAFMGGGVINPITIAGCSIPNLLIPHPSDGHLTMNTTLFSELQKSRDTTKFVDSRLPAAGFGCPLGHKPTRVEKNKQPQLPPGSMLDWQAEMFWKVYSRISELYDKHFAHHPASVDGNMIITTNNYQHQKEKKYLQRLRSEFTNGMCHVFQSEKMNQFVKDMAEKGWKNMDVFALVEACEKAPAQDIATIRFTAVRMIESLRPDMWEESETVLNKCPDKNYDHIYQCF